MDLKITNTIDLLRKNGFEVWFANDKTEAEQLFWNDIFTPIKPSVVSWGDSQTLKSLDILPKIREIDGVELIETFGNDLSWREQINNRKKALSCGMFLTGTNAITIKGQLVNIDMIGNRVAGIAFGPKNVVIFTGINKIVKDIDEAIERIKTYAAPMNAKSHTDIETPCQKTGKCSNCSSSQRICNVWTITEKSYPANRIKIVIINKELGY